MSRGWTILHYILFVCTLRQCVTYRVGSCYWELQQTAQGICQSPTFSCFGRCGSLLDRKEIKCACDERCRVYGDCCWDFDKLCPTQMERGKKKYSHVLGAASICAPSHQDVATLFRSFAQLETQSQSSLTFSTPDWRRTSMTPQTTSNRSSSLQDGTDPRAESSEMLQHISMTQTTPDFPTPLRDGLETHTEWSQWRMESRGKIPSTTSQMTNMYVSDSIQHGLSVSTPFHAIGRESSSSPQIPTTPGSSWLGYKSVLHILHHEYMHVLDQTYGLLFHNVDTYEYFKASDSVKVFIPQSVVVHRSPVTGLITVTSDLAGHWRPCRYEDDKINCDGCRDFFYVHEMCTFTFNTSNFNTSLNTELSGAVNSYIRDYRETYRCQVETSPLDFSWHGSLLAEIATWMGDLDHFQVMRVENEDKAYIVTTYEQTWRTIYCSSAKMAFGDCQILQCADKYVPFENSCVRLQVDIAVRKTNDSQVKPAPLCLCFYLYSMFQAAHGQTDPILSYDRCQFGFHFQNKRNSSAMNLMDWYDGLQETLQAKFRPRVVCQDLFESFVISLRFYSENVSSTLVGCIVEDDLGGSEMDALLSNASGEVKCMHLQSERNDVANTDHSLGRNTRSGLASVFFGLLFVQMNLLSAFL